MQKAILIDFGISTRMAQEASSLLNPDALEGTLAYMSPEQTGRVSRIIDYRTDYYSLGVSLYEVLTGVHPFPSTDAIELVHSHIAKQPRSPHEVVSEIPLVLSNIIMKLMAKAPENRYQSAYGLKADLQECLQQYEATGQINVFPLGIHDRGGQLRIPQNLVGRHDEMAVLEERFLRVKQGAAELVMLKGAVGVGKTALVNELYKSLMSGGAYLVTGRFDPFNRSIPYSAIAEALRELTRQVLSAPNATLVRYREQLRTALGNNGGLLLDLIPDLRLIIGEQAAVPTVGLAESQNRFNLVFQNFLHVFATSERPLVVFLDDLQFADPSSLRLLQSLLTDPERGYFLIIGAYRDNEVSDGHPLLPVLKALCATSSTVTEIKVSPLDHPSVTDMIASVLGIPSGQTEPLSQVVYEKTYGNPFFVKQFLVALHAEKLLRFEASTKNWTWNLREIQERIVTANVADLLIEKIQKLSAPTQYLLKEAACIGFQFDIQLLSRVHGKSAIATISELWEALQESLLLPIDVGHGALPPANAEKSDEVEETEEFVAHYRFVHDRLHHTVYSLISPAERQQIHLRIGRLLLADGAKTRRDDALFNTVYHLTLGAPLITDAAERLNLAHLGLQAGRRAKAATAYPAACGHLAAGMAMLDKEAEQKEYDLAFALYLERAECEHIDGRIELADSLFDNLLTWVRTRSELVYIYHVRASLGLMDGLYAETVNKGLLALAEFGIHFPATPEEQQYAVQSALAEVDTNMAGRRIMDLANAPVITDKELAGVLQLLNTIAIGAYLININLWSLLTLKMLNISLQQGNSADSAGAYVTYGFMLATGMGRYEEGYEFGCLALDLNDRFQSAHLTAKLNMIFSNTMFFRQPVRSALTHVDWAYQAGLDCGDFLFVSAACFSTVLWRLILGEDLNSLQETIGRFLSLVQRTMNPVNLAMLIICHQRVACLLGKTNAANSLSDATFNEEDYRASLEKSQNLYALVWCDISKLYNLYLNEEYEAAETLLLSAETRSTPLKGLHITTELPFYGSLILLASASAKESIAEGPHAALLAGYQRQLAIWAENCPANFERRHLLVSAEAARVSGRDIDASVLYAQAIAQAQKDGVQSDEALATLLCAKFYLARGRNKLASAYMTDSHYLYLRWGAVVKARDIAQRYAHLLEVPTPPPIDGVSQSSSSGSRAVTSEALDSAMVVRAAHAIASEILLDKALDRVMRIVASNAGAQRGFLLLDRNGQQGREGALFVTASIDVSSDEVQVDLHQPLESCSDLAVSVVQYVTRTRLPVVLSDATAEPRFAGDAYIAAQKPKSLLCLALQHRGRLTGVLYLENNSAPGVFTADRLELLRLLSSQAATAVENALLYGHVQQMTEQLQRGNDELRIANERLQVELAERTRAELERTQAEQERANLQEQIITVQRARLAEMSTPLIPLTEQIMVMPLIGTMDTHRANMVLETALQGAQTNRAQVVIIDITGMKHVDTNVAGALIKSASALRLLGAQAILTGIRAEVAQTLVSLGIDMSSIVTTGTLQSGIAYALKLSGGSFLSPKAQPGPREAASKKARNGI